MVETSLSKETIDVGAELVRKLDEHGMAPNVALWLYEPEEQAWRLVLVDTKLSQAGPKAAYAKLQEVFTKHAADLQGLELDDIVLQKPNSRIIDVMRKAIRTGSGISGIRFTNNVIDGTLIEDAYVYRVA